METLLNFMRENAEIIRPIWFLLGILSIWILSKYTRKSFFKDRSSFWWIAACLYYMVVAPLVFSIVIITLFNPEKG